MFYITVKLLHEFWFSISGQTNHSKRLHNSHRCLFKKFFYAELEGRQDVGIAVDLKTCYANILSSFLSVCGRGKFGIVIGIWNSV